MNNHLDFPKVEYLRKHDRLSKEKMLSIADAASSNENDIWNQYSVMIGQYSRYELAHKLIDTWNSLPRKAGKRPVGWREMAKKMKHCEYKFPEQIKIVCLALHICGHELVVSPLGKGRDDRLYSAGQAEENLFGQWYKAINDYGSQYKLSIHLDDTRRLIGLIEAIPRGYDGDLSQKTLHYWGKTCFPDPIAFISLVFWFFGFQLNAQKK